MGVDFMDCPKEVTVEMREEELLKDMDGYDPDSYNEDSVDWLGVEIGNSMETLIIEDWEELQDLLSGDYRDYVISDEDVREAFYEWQEFGE